jgi:hypothetical protein
MIGIVVFFSLPRSKLVGYVLPAAPPLAALIADAIWRVSNDPARTERRLRALTVFAALVCMISAVAIRLADERTSGPLARVLAERKAAGDGVIFVGAYYYDVPLLARLGEPVQVVESWNAVDIATRDNWRKELYEGSRFAPKVADALLIDRPDFAKLLCQRPVTWVLSPRQAGPATYPVLATVAPVATTARSALWRFDNSACVSAGQMPTDGLQGK